MENVIQIGVEQFVVQQTDVVVRHTIQIHQGSAGFVERQPQVQNHAMLVRMIFRGIGAQVFKRHRDKVGINFLEEPGRQSQGFGLFNEVGPGIDGHV